MLTYLIPYTIIVVTTVHCICNIDGNI